MQNLMKYKGYHGQISYNDEEKIFRGEVIGLKDIVGFQGTSISELQIAFKDSINDYLKRCNHNGEKPDKNFSGNIRIRIASELHAKLAHEAANEGVSLNDIIIKKLQK